MKIKYIQIYGERNSGTNYLSNLLQANVLNKLDFSNCCGWKHGFVNWRLIRKQNQKDILFLFITKDPYSWLVSMNRKPHHAPQLYNMEFSEFLSQEWACYKGDDYHLRAVDLDRRPLRDEEEMLHERNPSSGARIENVIKLRNLKNRSFLSVAEECDNFEHIRYEDLLLRRDDILRDLRDKYSFKLVEESRDVSGYYGLNPSVKFNKLNYYLSQDYLNLFSDSDLDFVNSQLNWDLEMILGYNKIQEKFSYSADN